MKNYLFEELFYIIFYLLIRILIFNYEYSFQKKRRMYNNRLINKKKWIKTGNKNYLLYKKKKQKTK